MKLKEKIKRFLTLDVHGHEGFTLVELIIVIAILAILSSVAVVGQVVIQSASRKMLCTSARGDLPPPVGIPRIAAAISDGR